MDDRFNTIAGWTLFAGIVALGFASVSAKVFHADNPEAPETFGYFVQGVEEEGGESGPSLAMALSEADVASGESVFAKCISCHTIAQGGANGTGPNLYGVMGSAIGGHAAGFAYSPALKEKGGTWDFAAMDEWLKSPRGYAPGTKMSFAGLSKIEDRAAVILYLNSMGSNLPLPEVEAPVADADAPVDDNVATDGDTSGVSETPGGAAGPSDAAGAAAAGAMAQPGLKATGGDASTNPVD